MIIPKDRQDRRRATLTSRHGKPSKHETTAPPERLAADLTALIDVKDSKRSEEAMQHSTRAGLTSEVRSVYVPPLPLRPRNDVYLFALANGDADVRSAE
jgi:hypothetical protein